MNDQELKVLARLEEALADSTRVNDRLANMLAEQSGLLRPPDLVALRKKMESGEVIPYTIKSFSLTTARTDVEVVVEGEFVQAWTDGNYDGIGVRFNHDKNDLVYFQRRNPVRGFRFWKIYLTHTAQVGKTLDLLILREDALAGTLAAPVAISKTIETDLQAIATLAADVVAISSELDVSGQVKKVTIDIFHAKDHASASVGQGAEYSIEVSSKATGNDAWVSKWKSAAAITAPTAMITDAEEAVGQTVIECGAAVPAIGDIIFFKNGTLANSEWSEVVARVTTGGSETVTLKDALTNTQAQGTYYTQGEKWSITINVESEVRLRVVANNAGGTTNRAVVWKVAARTVE